VPPLPGGALSSAEPVTNMTIKMAATSPAGRLQAHTVQTREPLDRGLVVSDSELEQPLAHR
jgi:hypothetical protein